MNEFLVFIIHFSLAVGLFFITNWIGRHSYSIGYMQISIFVKSETAPAFNFLFRVLSPVVYIIIVSAVLYKIGLDGLVTNIYLVTIYYIGFRILFNVLTNRAKLLNWSRQFIHAISMSIISWLVYDSIIKDKKNILPDFSTISNELWIIILLFVFQVLNNLTFSTGDTEKRKENYLMSRYSKFKNKYGSLINDLTKNKRLEALAYAIMIYEDFNRPNAARLIENLKFRLTKKTMTLGVMQVKSSQIIDDFESVKKGMEKLIFDLKEIISKNEVGREGPYRDWEILSKLIEKFNGGKSYNHEVSDLFWIIWNKLYDGQNNNISFEE